MRLPQCLPLPAVVAALLLASGCAQPSSPEPAISVAPAQLVSARTVQADTAMELPTTQPSGPVAVFTDEEGSVELPYDEFVTFLVETRGLDALLHLMQLELAKEQARRFGVEVTQADVAEERERVLEQAFAGIEGVSEEDYDQLLAQLLAQRQLTQTEFDVINATNANLRAVAEPAVREKLTEEVLREAFAARYGEKAHVRVIATDTLPPLAAAKERLDAGESFEAVAAEVNRDPGLLRNEGRLEPFTRQATLPDAFKAAAFALEPGEVSDPVQAAERYFLIRLDELAEPTAVRFENIRDELKEQLVQEQTEVLVPQLRRQLMAALASSALEIKNPVLAEQLAARLAELQPQPTDPEELKDRMERERPTTGPATRPLIGPNAAPAAAPATQPAAVPAAP